MRAEGTLTAPLNLRRYLRRQDDRMDSVPFVDLMLLGLFFSLTSSSFLLPPGVPINLPRNEGTAIVSEPVAAVVTVLPPAPGEDSGLIIFGGDIIHQNALEEALREFLRVHPSGEPILLLKMDAKASISQLVSISSAARSSGFSAVQIAAEEQQSGTGLFEE